MEVSQIPGIAVPGLKNVDSIFNSHADKKVKLLEELVSSSYFVAGLACIPGIKNEDAHVIFAPDTGNMTAFGVFDGHGGNFASENCASEFCRQTFQLLSQMIEKSEAINAPSKFRHMSKSDIFDALFCESVRQIMIKMDEDAVHQGTSGTTCVCLFTFPLSDGSTKLLCVNVGDSRCCLSQDVGIPTCLSEDHTLLLPREHKRLTQRRSAKWWALPAAPKFGFNLELTINRDISTCYPNSDKLSEARKFVRLVNRSLKIEADIDAVDDGSHVSDSSAVPYLNIDNIADMTAIDIDFSMETTKQPTETFIASKVAGSEEGRDESVHIRSSSSVASQAVSRDGSMEGSQEQEVIQMVYKESFISRRQSATKMGPKTLVSRYNLSTTMSRSVGDKYGPRSCECMPEVTVTTLAPGEFARVLIGTDGLWDMYRKPEPAMNSVEGMIDVGKAATKLAKEARRWREAGGRKIDDITVMVVDINPTARSARTKSSPDNMGCGCSIS